MLNRHIFPLTLYRMASAICYPFLLRMTRKKLHNFDISKERSRERSGHPSNVRPNGTLIWFHAASVGESLTVLPLINAVSTLAPEARFLVTSGTATSAEILAKRLPENAYHQFAPLDATISGRRFLNHWRPNAAVFIESEIWPNILTNLDNQGIKRALLNARLSKTSRRNWARLSGTMRVLFGGFQFIHCQDGDTAEFLENQETEVFVGQNVKSAVAPTAIDKDDLAEIKKSLSGRKVWLASSTHPGEETEIIFAHKQLLQLFPDLILILVPRHPERRDEVSKHIEGADLSFKKRSKSGKIGMSDQVYLADTIGELPLWYHVAPIAFIAGSFSNVGGHNPYEAAHANCAILHGPKFANFEPTYRSMLEQGASRSVTSANELANEVRLLLDNPDKAQAASDAAKRFSQSAQNSISDLAAKILNLV